MSSSDDFIDVLIIDQYGNPVEGANVNLTSGTDTSGNSGIYTNETTDFSGHAYVPIDDSFVGYTVDVTVTCQDCLYSETSFFLNSDIVFPEVENLTITSTEIGMGNGDGFINVVDIVQLVNIILEPAHQNPNFVLDDLNPASNYYGESIGPSYFDNQVSCYYFGKQG